MSDSSWYLDYHGNAWEEMCNTLLCSKHGAQYQPISDNGGDLGLDGLLISENTAYQAYGQEPENKDAKGGVQSKIRTDLKKLKTNQNEIQAILGVNKINKWVLLLNKKIPHNDLHKYAKNKQDEVLSWNLPFIDNENFQVIIQPPSFFKTEYLEYKKKRDDRIEIEISPPALPCDSELKKTDSFNKIFNKFKAVLDDAEAEKLAYEEVKNYIELSIQLDTIRKQEPDFYSAIEEVRSDVEKEAEQGSLLDGTFSSFSNTKHILETRLNNKIERRLGTQTLSRVRQFVIADWFVRCPLRFKNNKGK